MSEWSPPSVPRPWLAGIAVVYLFIMAYAVVIAGQILLGILIGVLFGTLYLGWRFIVAFEAIADGVQRIAHSHEHD